MDYIDIELPHPPFEDPADAPAALLEALGGAVGHGIRFGNGCVLYLKPDAGMYWGDNPYGQPWACSVAEGWEVAVLRWFAYWNQPRSESGALRTEDRV